jgi:hypothetical protein
MKFATTMGDPEILEENEKFMKSLLESKFV